MGEGTQVEFKTEYPFVADQGEVLRAFYADDKLWRMSYDSITPAIFTKQEHKWIISKMRSHFEKHNMVPTRKELARYLDIEVNQTGALKEPFYKSYRKAIVLLKSKEAWQPNSSTINDLSLFVKRQAVYQITVKCIEYLNHKSPEDIGELGPDLIKCANAGEFKTGGAIEALNLHEMLAVERRKEEDGSACYAGTGVLEIDRYIPKGGIKAGELGVLLGSYNTGKSFALLECAMAAVHKGYNVLYVTCEMGEEDIRQRAICHRVGMNLSNMGNDVFRYESELIKRYDKLDVEAVKRFKTKEYRTGDLTVSQLAGELDYMRDVDGFIPDVIVVDYADIMKGAASNKNDDNHILKGAIYQDLRGLAQQRRVPLWTATQANREGMGKEIITGKHISESLDKARIADVVVSMSSTSEDEEHNVVRLYIEKNRKGKKGVVVEVNRGFDWGRFYLGIVSEDDDENTEFQNKVRPVIHPVGATSAFRAAKDWLPAEYLEAV